MSNVVTAYISSTGTQSHTLPINAVARDARLWFANTGSTAKAVAEVRVFGAPTPPQSVSKYYFLGKQRLAMRQNGKLTYLHGDQLGSASLATDAAGVTLSQQRYLPYGGLRWAQSGSVFPTDWQYTDQQRQTTHLTGIGMVEYYDYRARMYDPKIGRFISPDSVVPDEKNPQSLNRYMYTLGNPVKFTDPSGHEVCTNSDDDACRNNARGLHDKAAELKYLVANGYLLPVEAFAALSDHAMHLFGGDAHGYMWGMTNVLLGVDMNTQSVALTLKEAFGNGNTATTDRVENNPLFIGRNWLNYNSPNVDRWGNGDIGMANRGDWKSSYFDGSANQAFHFWTYAAITYQQGTSLVASPVNIAHEIGGGIGSSWADLMLGEAGINFGIAMNTKRFSQNWGGWGGYASFDPSAWIRQNLKG